LDPISKLKNLPQGSLFADAKKIDKYFSKSSMSWSEIIEAFEKRRNEARIREIPINLIKITQPNIQLNKVSAMIPNADKLPIISAVKFKNGEIAIFDGHHRLITLWALDRKTIKVNLLEL
jgi:hypothetical protein